jgi:hypothetical protein
MSFSIDTRSFFAMLEASGLPLLLVSPDQGAISGTAGLDELQDRLNSLDPPVAVRHTAPDCGEGFRHCFGLDGSPSFRLYDRGVEVGRLSGRHHADAVTSFVRGTLALKRPRSTDPS